MNKLEQVSREEFEMVGKYRNRANVFGTRRKHEKAKSNMHKYRGKVSDGLARKRISSRNDDGL